jgi:nitrite reductase (NO-forming)
VKPNGKTQAFDIELGDLFVRPSSISVSYGTWVVLHVVNHGAMSHDLQLEGGSLGTGMLAPGQRQTVDYGVFGHTGQAWCTVPGHKAAGMILTIRVTGAAQGAALAGQSGRDAVISLSARPPAGWRPFNPALPPAPAGTVHRITLVAEDNEIQVAPGVTQDMWTFNGQVPGPTLRGHVGDEFIVTLVNHSSMGHSLDFHAASQPIEAMRTIGPGQSITERFRARYSGIYLYHCGTRRSWSTSRTGCSGRSSSTRPTLPRWPMSSSSSSPSSTSDRRANRVTTRRCSAGSPTPWCSTVT